MDWFGSIWPWLLTATLVSGGAAVWFRRRRRRGGFERSLPEQRNRAIWADAATSLAIEQVRQDVPVLKGEVNEHRVTVDTVTRDGMGQYTRVGVDLGASVPVAFSLGEADVLSSLRADRPEAQAMSADVVLRGEAQSSLWASALQADQPLASRLAQVITPGSTERGLAVSRRKLYLEARGFPGRAEALTELVDSAVAIAAALEGAVPTIGRALVAQLGVDDPGVARAALGVVLDMFPDTAVSERALALADASEHPELRAECALYREDAPSVARAMAELIDSSDDRLLESMIAFLEAHGGAEAVVPLTRLSERGLIQSDIERAAEKAILTVQSRLGPERAGALTVAAPAEDGRLSVAEEAGALAIEETE